MRQSKSELKNEAPATWRVPLLGVALLGILILLVAACGGDDDDSSPSPSDGEATASASPNGTPISEPEGTPGGSAICSNVSDAARGLITTHNFTGDQAVREAGEEIEMILTLANCGDNLAVLEYPSTQRVDFIVEDENGVEVWRSSDGKAYEETEGTQVIEPGETVIYTETWDQTDREGEQALGGIYKVSLFSVGCIEEAREDCKFGPVGLVEIGETNSE